MSEIVFGSLSVVGTLASSFVLYQLLMAVNSRLSHH